MIRILILSLGFFCFAGTVTAKDIPDFLVDKVYSTDTSKCGDSTEDNSLQLSKEGVFGFEYGCTFFGFNMDVDKDTGKTYIAVARANCGDDSGVSRPDLMTLVVQDEKTISVQSQNEYVISQAQLLLSQRLPENIKLQDEIPNYISRDYKLCK